MIRAGLVLIAVGLAGCAAPDARKIKALEGIAQSLKRIEVLDTTRFVHQAEPAKKEPTEKITYIMIFRNHPPLGQAMWIQWLEKNGECLTVDPVGRFITNRARAQSNICNADACPGMTGTSGVR